MYSKFFVVIGRKLGVDIGKEAYKIVLCVVESEWVTSLSRVVGMSSTYGYNLILFIIFIVAPCIL